MGTAKLLGLIQRLAQLGYQLGLAIAVLYAILLGWRYVQSGGKVEQIHQELLLLLLGVALIIASFSIPTIIRSFIER